MDFHQITLFDTFSILVDTSVVKSIQNFGFDTPACPQTLPKINTVLAVSGFLVKFLFQVYSEPCQTCKMEYFVKIETA